jgi:hypothetical protein
MHNSEEEHIATFECLEHHDEIVFDWCLVGLAPNCCVMAQDFADLFTFIATEACTQ